MMFLDPPIGETWIIAKVRSQVMRQTREKLRDLGVYSFFPGRNVQRHRFGRTWTVERAEVPGYIFVKVSRVPHGDVWRERLPGFAGFVMERGQIVTVHPAIIKRLHGLSVEAQELEAARRDLLRIREGDMARFITGALAGHLVEVQGIGRVVTVLLNGMQVKTEIHSLERVTADE